MIKSYIINIAPGVAVDIRGYPIDSNFFTGLQLNLTCTIQVLLETSPLLTIFTNWRKSDSRLSSNSRVTVEELPVQVGPQLYHTSVLFNSLNQTRDEGEYMCAVSLVLSLEGYQDATTESTATYSLIVPSKSIDTNSY